MSLHTLASQRLVDYFDYNKSKRIALGKSCVEDNLHRASFQVQVGNGLSTSWSGIPQCVRTTEQQVIEWSEILGYVCG